VLSLAGAEGAAPGVGEGADADGLAAVAGEGEMTGGAEYSTPCAHKLRRHAARRPSRQSIAALFSAPNLLQSGFEVALSYIFWTLVPLRRCRARFEQ